MKLLKRHLIAVLAMAMTGCVVIAEHPDDSAFSQAELDQMLAPIALYPDVLLSQVLMASTYPLEVVEAARWSRSNTGLEGDDAVLAVEEFNWDESVKYLTGFPDLIQLMDEQLSWTRRLGDAFLLQEEQVMETIQVLRQKSLAEGSMDSVEHVEIQRENDIIVIQPAEVEVVYVPYYSPFVVYGSWWWHDYPPFYWGPSFAYNSGVRFHWSRGYRVSVGFYFSFCDWHHHRIYVRDHHRHHRRYDFDGIRDHQRHDRNATVWRHDPEHRRGVDYRRDVLRERYERRSSSGITSSRVPSPDENTRPSRTTPAERESRHPSVDKTRWTNRATRVAGQQDSEPYRELRDREVRRASSIEKARMAEPQSRVVRREDDQSRELQNRETRGNANPPGLQRVPPGHQKMPPGQVRKSNRELGSQRSKIISKTQPRVAANNRTVARPAPKPKAAAKSPPVSKPAPPPKVRVEQESQSDDSSAKRWSGKSSSAHRSQPDRPRTKDPRMRTQSSDP